MAAACAAMYHCCATAGAHTTRGIIVQVAIEHAVATQRDEYTDWILAELVDSVSLEIQYGQCPPKPWRRTESVAELWVGHPAAVRTTVHRPSADDCEITVLFPTVDWLRCWCSHRCPVCLISARSVHPDAGTGIASSTPAAPWLSICRPVSTCATGSPRRQRTVYPASRNTHPTGDAFETTRTRFTARPPSIALQRQRHGRSAGDAGRAR